MCRTCFTLPVLRGLIALCIAVTASPAIAAEEAEETDFFVYVGTYTRGESAGVYRFRFDAETGECGEPQLAAEAENPSFLAIHPDEELLFAVNEIGEFEGEAAGAVTAFRIDRRTGDLETEGQVSSRGGAPCHLVVDQTGRYVLVANYSGGSVCVLPVGEDGSLGEAVSFVQHEGSSVDPRRQQAPHAHSINLDAGNRYAVVADLGLDQLLVYCFDEETGQLTPNDPPGAAVAPGAGPRHFAFHPDGEHAYVINEMHRTVTVFHWDAEHGMLTEQQTITTVPESVTDGSTAEIRVHPSGRFVYGSNRGHDSIAIFAVEEESGRLTAVGHQSTEGRTPRNFFIDPTGKWLFAGNQSSDTIVLFAIDAATGELEPAGTVIDVPSPVCIRMLAR